MPAPDLFYSYTLADRFKLLMRSPGRVRSVMAANVVTIETDEGEERLRSNAQAACKILGVTSSIETPRPNVYRVTLLEIA